MGPLYFEDHSAATEALRRGHDGGQGHCIGAAPTEVDRRAMVGVTEADQIYGIAGPPGVRAAVSGWWEGSLRGQGERAHAEPAPSPLMAARVRSCVACLAIRVAWSSER